MTGFPKTKSVESLAKEYLGKACMGIFEYIDQQQNTDFEN